MSKDKKGAQYEVVLEGRHLVGVFFAVVLLCAIFFTLGFVLGRDRERAAARAAALQARTAEKSVPVSSAPEKAAATELGFYQRVGGGERSEKLSTSAPGASSLSAKQVAIPPAAKPPAQPARAPVASPANPVFLQVAAVTEKDDAERLREKLYQLGFPSRVLSPASDRFYRVQVGPFDNSELAAAAQRRLEAQGFRVLVKH